MHVYIVWGDREGNGKWQGYKRKKTSTKLLHPNLLCEHIQCVCMESPQRVLQLDCGLISLCTLVVTATAVARCCAETDNEETHLSAAEVPPLQLTTRIDTSKYSR